MLAAGHNADGPEEVVRATGVEADGPECLSPVAAPMTPGSSKKPQQRVRDRASGAAPGLGKNLENIGPNLKHKYKKIQEINSTQNFKQMTIYLV